MNRTLVTMRGAESYGDRGPIEAPGEGRGAGPSWLSGGYTVSRPGPPILPMTSRKEVTRCYRLHAAKPA